MALGKGSLQIISRTCHQTSERSCSPCCHNHDQCTLNASLHGNDNNRRPSKYTDHDYDSMVSKTSEKSSGRFVRQSAVTHSQGYSGIGKGTSFPAGCFHRCLFCWQMKQPCTYSRICVTTGPINLYDACSGGLQLSSSVTNLWLVFIVY